MSKEVRITEAVPAEAEALTAIAFAAKRHWGYPERWIERWRSALTITSDFIAAQEVFVVRTERGNAGFGALTVAGGVASLEHLWVLPETMGRGLGRALFAHAVKCAAERALPFFQIEADPNAASFYERMGAVRVATRQSVIDGVRRELPVLRYWLERSAKRGEMDLPKLLAGMKPKLRGGEFVFCLLQEKDKADVVLNSHALGSFQEEEGTTLILPREIARSRGLPAEPTFAQITLRVHSNLESVGFLAAVTRRLAAHGIPTNAVSAFHHDHLFVSAPLAAQAITVLLALEAESAWTVA